LAGLTTCRHNCAQAAAIKRRGYETDRENCSCHACVCGGVTANGAPLTLRKPVVYQTIEGQRKRIAGEYKLHGNRVQFTLGAYDRGPRSCRSSAKSRAIELPSPVAI
jgi:hypothetical protein